jgi:Na+:H+ antiporter, NhaA family
MPLLRRPARADAARYAEILRDETVGGMLLLAAASIAFAWANSPWGRSYHTFGAWTVGPVALHLHLSLAAWAADGMLALFFFVAGLELKHEFIAGDLRNPSQAALPIIAAVGGMVVPAAIYVAVDIVLGHGDKLAGWAVPTATDIAFALAVLAVLSTHLPAALRTFLLTLAVVDDLLAIIVIAAFYTGHLVLGPLALALIPGGMFALAVSRGISRWWVLLPLALVTWALVQASGVHPTVSGVLLAFTVPVRGRTPATAGMAERFEHVLRPLSAAVAVPVFAFFAAGVTVGGWSGMANALSHPVAIGVVAGLVIGKPVGVFATTYLLARFTGASLDDELAWSDVLGVALLAGIGFTVALLIGGLAFGRNAPELSDVTIAVLTGSVLAALLAAVVLRARNATYRRIAADEER